MSKNILVFDDSIDLLDTFKVVLSTHGYTVRTAKNKLIFENALKEKPDLILLDVMLAGMDGRDVCKELKSDRLTKDIHIILMSASPGLLNNYRECFADDILEKPFNLKELFYKIEDFRSYREGE